MFTTYYNDPNLIQYHVTRPPVPIVDTDGKGTYNISPVGFPVRNVSGELGINPTLIIPDFSVGYNDVTQGGTSIVTNYTNFNTNVTELLGYQSFSESLTSITNVGTTATVTSILKHGYTNGLQVVIDGVSDPLYNGSFIISNVTDFTFDYTMSGTPAFSATGLLRSTFTLSPNTANIILSAQDISTTNGFYTSSEDRWVILVTEGSLYEPVMANTVVDTDITAQGTPYTIQHPIQEIIGDGTIIDIKTIDISGYQVGASITIIGTVSFDGVYIIDAINSSTSFSVLSAVAGIVEVVGTVDYSVQEGELVNLVAQTDSTENGIYTKNTVGWDYWGCFYTWDGTENDNVEGLYPPQINPETGEVLQPNHYRRGYSAEEVTDWLRSQLDTPIEFGKFRGADKSNNLQGAMTQWLLSGRKVNIGGQGVNKEIWVQGFGKGDPSQTNAGERTTGDVDVDNFVEVLEAREKVVRYNKQALWGLTNHESRTLTGITQTSPYVKDYPFVYNSEYVDSTGIGSAGFVSVDDDVERWLMSIPGSALSGARTLDQSILYYFRDNSYHNNITLDMGKDETFGRHNLVVNNTLDTQDVVPLGAQYFADIGVDIVTDRIEVQSGIQFAVDDVIWFIASDGGTLPVPLIEKSTYFIESIVADEITLKDASGVHVDLTTIGSGVNNIVRLAFVPYSNVNLKSQLDDLVDNATFSNNIQIIKRKIDGDIISYYFAQRIKESLTDIILKGTGTWAPDILTYDAPNANAIKIYLDAGEVDYVQFDDGKKTTAELLQSLKDNNNLIPLPFEDDSTGDNDTSFLQQLFVYSDVVDYSDPVNNTAKIHSKKTFIHLPTPVDLDDGTPFDLDVSVLAIPSTNPFGYNTVGSLSGYRNYVTQPRVYVLSGTQELDLSNIAVDTLTQTGGLASLTAVNNVDIYSTLFDETDILIDTDQIKVIEEYRVGEEVVVVQGDSSVLPTGLTDGETYIVSSFAAFRITLETIGAVPIILTDDGTNTNWLIRKSEVILCVEGADDDLYNDRFIAVVSGRNSFEFPVANDAESPATGNIIISQIVRAEGADGTKGLTERRNTALFGSTPENEYSNDTNAYHQTFTSDDIFGLNMDKRVLLASVYPTNTSTFGWRVDNDPHMRMLQWSLLNVNAAGGDSETGSFANVAYRRNLDIKNEFSGSFNFSIYDNPLSYNTALTPSESQQHLAGFLRVLLPEKLGPHNESDLLSDEDFNTVGSFTYQGAEGLRDLISDFSNGRVRVDSRDDNSGLQSDAKNFQHGYDGNHGSINIPTSFYDQLAGQEFIAFNTTASPNPAANNAYRWITKGLYSPEYIVEAEGATSLTTLDSYATTGVAFKTYLSAYFADDARDTNAGNRYVPGELDPVTDPDWEFAVNDKQKFIKFLLGNGELNSMIDDVRRRFWDSYYTIPEGEDRQIQNIFQINTNDSVLSVTKFNGMYWLPFARVFSTDYEVPPEINVINVDDYATITGGLYPEVAATLGKSLESNPIAQRFYEDGYDESFVSVNTNNSSNVDLEEFLRNYINGYSNLMPYRFYNNFRGVVNGTLTSSSNSTNIALNEINTEMDVERIYKFSVRDYLEQYGDTPPSVEIGQAIDDNFTLHNIDIDTGTDTVVAEDYNPAWMYFEEGNPISDPLNSTIKNLITVSGQNYLADREFYREKMLYNYTRVKIKLVFSRKLGRWMTLDYRQVPTSYLTPTFGAVALDETEQSTIVSGQVENTVNDYIQVILPRIDTIYEVSQIVDNDGLYDVITFISDSAAPVYVSEDVMIYIPQDVTKLTSPQISNTAVYTSVIGYIGITPFGAGQYAHTIELSDMVGQFIDTSNVRIASQLNTINDGSYPFDNVTQTTNTDFIWNRDSCQDSANVYKQLENTGYYQMQPNELNRGVVPYLSPLFPYDSNGNRVSELDPEIDSTGAENYRLQRLLEPQKSSPTGINFVVPNNIHGGATGADENLFLFQPHMWRTYWHMRPSISCMDGTDIPARNSYVGGVMADPVLNSMFYWPDPRNIQYAIPWHVNMTQNWYEGGFLIIDADRSTFDGCTSIIIDADISNIVGVPFDDPLRPNYPIYDSDRFTLGF